MESISSRLIRQSGLYALGNVALKASGLLLAVFYLNPAYLSPEDFGYYGLLIVTAQLGIFVAGMGLNMGLLKFMTDAAYEADRPSLPFTVFVATTVSAAGLLALLWVAAEPFSRLLLDTADRAVLIRLMALYVALKAVLVIPLMVLRVKERAGLFALVMGGEMVFLIAGAYYLLVVKGLGLYGLVLAHTLAAGATAFVLVGLMLVRVPWRFAPRLVRLLVRFGAPLVMVSLASWFLKAGDRYLLKWLLDAEAVGLYEWAARLASVLNLLLVQSFQQAFAVIGLKALGRAGGADAAIHRATFRHYVIWAGWAALGLSLLAYDLTLLLPADARYLQTDDLVLFLALGFLANGVYYVIVNLIYGSGRTQDISLNVLAVAGLNVALNLALIPLFGVIGAAFATFVSYFTLAGGAAFFARRDVTVRFPWRLLAIVVVLIVGLYVLSQPSTAWTTGARLSLRFGLVLAYPAFLVATGLYTRDDLRQVRRGIKQALQGGPARKRQG